MYILLLLNMFIYFFSAKLATSPSRSIFLSLGSGIILVLAALESELELYLDIYQASIIFAVNVTIIFAVNVNQCQVVRLDRGKNNAVLSLYIRLAAPVPGIIKKDSKRLG